MSEPILVIGGGHAAAHLITELCKQGGTNVIHLLTEEAHLPYQRPPLSKGFLAGDTPLQRLPIKSADFYQQNEVKVSLNTCVIQIDRENKRVQTQKGDWLNYSKLALVTGARARKLSTPGSDLEGIHYLRNIADVEGVQQHWQSGKKLLIIGAGYIGLEVAAVAVRHGLDVTVLEMADRIMNRTVAPEMSAFYHEVHTAEGVKILTSTGVEKFEGEQQVSAAITTSGERLECDFVIAGIGILPNQELAQDANLTCSNGIVVDQYAMTNDPDIVAAGDCTSHPNDIYGKQIRLESVHNAMEQGKTAAASLMENSVAYQQTPWFWSDQYELKLQMIGLSEGYDDLILRGDVADKQFSLFYLKQGRLIAVNTVSDPKEFMQIKKLIATQPRVNTKVLKDVNSALDQAFAAE